MNRSGIGGLFPRALAVGAVFFIAISTAACEDTSPGSFIQKSSGGATGSKFFKPDPEDIEEDESTGLKVIKGVLNIHISPKLSREEAEKIIASSDGEIVGYDYAVNFFQARYKLDAAALEGKKLDLLSIKGVETVTRASVSVHENIYYVK